MKTQSTRRAVIDVGTNSVKLLVADVRGGEVFPIFEDSEQTRLGRGFYETHELQPDPVKETAKAVSTFSKLAKKHDATSIRVIATSAARDAKNSGDLTAAVEKASGLKVEIISGEQEADWAFHGVTTNPILADKPILILDVGGGSTEFILGCGHEKFFRESFRLGTVRLLEKLPHSNPPAPEELPRLQKWLREFLQIEIQPALEPALNRVKKDGGIVQLVGTGGTANILARMENKLDAYNRKKIEDARLSLPQVQIHLQRLWSLPLSKRKKIPGLPANRADVILTGVAIYEAVIEQFGFAKFRVSTRGLRFAALMDPK